MELILNMDNNIIIENIYKSELDLDKTFNCGQAFRWIKEPTGEWVGVVNNHIWILKQYENCIMTNLRENNKDKLIEYLNLDMNYTSEISKLDLDDFAQKAYNYSKGIHILRQNLFETIVTFLMSSCNTMHNIRNIIEKLCITYGNKLTVKWNGKEYIRYSFPSIELLQELTEQDFRALNMGFRAKYLVELCKIFNNDFEVKLHRLGYHDSVYELTQLKGIGDKVANCIALFSLHHIQSFPIDTHIKTIINEHYNGNIDTDRYKVYKGIIQQYLFYYKAFINK